MCDSSFMHIFFGLAIVIAAVVFIIALYKLIGA